MDLDELAMQLEVIANQQASDTAANVIREAADALREAATTIEQLRDDFKTAIGADLETYTQLKAQLAAVSAERDEAKTMRHWYVDHGICPECAGDPTPCCESWDTCIRACTQRGYREQWKADVEAIEELPAVETDGWGKEDWADYLRSRGPK